MNDHDVCKAALDAAAKRIEELERENAELRKRPTIEQAQLAFGKKMWDETGKGDYLCANPLEIVAALYGLKIRGRLEAKG